MKVFAVLGFLVTLVSFVNSLEFVDINEYNKSAVSYISSHHHATSNSSSAAAVTVTTSNVTTVTGTASSEEKEVKTKAKEASAVTFLDFSSPSAAKAAPSVTASKKEDVNSSLSLSSPLNSSNSSAKSADAVTFLDLKADGNSSNTNVRTKKVSQDNTDSTSDTKGTNNSPTSGNVVFITGITGMLGSSVAKELVSTGQYKVIGLARADSSMERITAILPNISIVLGDITDAFHIIDILAEIKPDYLLHFAAQSSNSLSFDNPALTILVNIQGTLNMLEGLRRNGLLSTKFFYAGSWSEYGRSAEELDGQPLPETLKLDPVSPYGLSKAAAEQLTLQYYHNYGLPVAIGRFFFVLGRGTSTMIDIQEFCKKLVAIEFNQLSPIIAHNSNVKNQRDIIHAVDAAQAVVALFQRQRFVGEVFNIGSGLGTSTETLFKTLAAASPKAESLKVEFNSKLKVRHEKFVVADVNKLRNVTGWSPQLSVEKAVVDELKFWRKTLRNVD